MTEQKISQKAYDRITQLLDELFRLYEGKELTNAEKFELFRRLLDRSAMYIQGLMVALLEGREVGAKEALTRDGVWRSEAQ